MDSTLLSLLDAAFALARSGETGSPDTDRPLVTLTFVGQDGQNLSTLTLYAYDAESCLAEVDSHANQLVTKSDAQEIVALALAMMPEAE